MARDLEISRTKRGLARHTTDATPHLAPPAPTEDAEHALLRMQATVGNRATVAALAQAQFALEVGAADDAYEREADAVARQVVATLASGGSSTPPSGGATDEEAEQQHGGVVGRLLQRSGEEASEPIGFEGGPVSGGAEAQLRSASSGGAPLASGPRARLEDAFGGADFSSVRLHQGPAASDLNAQFGAKAFTVGSDIFFRGAAPNLTNRADTELLAHELTHTIQQAPQRAQRARIMREYVAGWDDVFKKLTPDAQLGYNQFVTLNGSTAAERARDGALEKAGDHVGEYNTDRAESVWSKKKMETAAFDLALSKKEARDTSDVKALLATMNHLCNETDGTHRPGSEGDGTSEWALIWEATHGEPFRSPAGHSLKIRDYCKVLSEGLTSLTGKKGSVKPGEKMQWTENKTAVAVEVEVLTQLALVVSRAADRLAKMRVGVTAWNNRITSYPDKWNGDGTSKVAPPGVDPLAKGQLVAGWPKEKLVKEY